MRIVHLVPAVYDGEGKQVEMLCHAAGEGSVHEVWRIAASSEIPAPWQRIDRTILKRWSLDPLTVVRLAVALRRAKPDVVHAWGRETARLLAFAQPAAHSGRVITLNETGLPGGWSRRTRRALRGPRTQVAVTHAELERMLRQQGVTSDTAEIIPYATEPCPEAAIPDSNFPQSAGIRMQLGLETDLPLIAYAGPLTGKQRVEELIWAACVLENVQRFALLIIGEGPQRPRLEHCNEVTRTTGSVFFLGLRPDVSSILRECLCYWTAETSGGLSSGVLEAQVAGIPVIASDTAAHRTMVADGCNGYLIRADRSVDFARRTRRLLAQPKLTRELGGAAQQSATERFAVHHAAEAYQALYHRTASRVTA